jgi:hypothetical protein
VRGPGARTRIGGRLGQQQGGREHHAQGNATRGEGVLPGANGKAERFIQTALREWACAAACPPLKRRASELPRWLHEDNASRNQSVLRGRPPTSRAGMEVDSVLQPHA